MFAMTTFCIYIDEAGDPGVKPKVVEARERTDWFTLGAIVSRTDRGEALTDWVKDMKEAVRSISGPALHYRNLSDTNRARVCRMLGRKPVRAFVVASHKDSMRKHYNRRLGRASDQEFYNWCLRLLFERITEWCFVYSAENGLPDATASIYFSERGGHKYEDLRSYLRKLEAQSLLGKLVLSRKGIAPGVIVDEHIQVVPHADLAGLQLADIVASSFYNASNSLAPKHDCKPALELKNIVARRPRTKTCAGAGLLLLPFAHQGEIPVEDRSIFKSFGYQL
jgi:hypothetical protein